MIFGTVTVMSSKGRSSNHILLRGVRSEKSFSVSLTSETLTFLSEGLDDRKCFISGSSD